MQISEWNSSAILAMRLFVVDQVTGIMETSVTVVAFERFDSGVPVEMHFKCLSSREFFTAHLANKFSLVCVSFSVAVAIPN